MTAPTVEVLHIGEEGEPVVVIDDFAADPDALIDMARALDFSTLGHFYPGVRSAVDPNYCAQIGPVVAAAARRVFGFSRHLAFDRVLFSLTVTPPGELTLAQRVPHIDDVAPGKLAIVHYLFRDDFGGTRFFRHRSTGFETITPERHRPFLDSLAADFERHGEPEPGYIAADTALFAATETIAPRFNRAIIYPSNLLHCAAIPNDAPLPRDPAIGRLTIASFLSAE